MTTRILQPEEYGRLAGTELEAVVPYLPADALVVVVEDGAEIVGCWAVYSLVHVEGVWIAPSHRGRSSVARRLLRGMMRAARAFGARAVCTAALDVEVATMLRKLGANELPGQHFTLAIPPESICADASYARESK